MTAKTSWRVSSRQRLAEQGADIGVLRQTVQFMAHVAQTGVSFRACSLWARRDGGGCRDERQGVDDGPHDAGFADSAYLSRTYRRVFGIAPPALVNATVASE